MKKIIAALLCVMMIICIAGCGNNENQEEQIREEVSAEYDQKIVNVCKLRAYKIGKQSYEIIDFYGNGEMSQQAAAKLLKMNYEELAELKDLDIYSEFDKTTLVGLHGNTMQAFNDVFDNIEGLAEDQIYINKCLERIENGESE